VGSYSTSIGLIEYDGQSKDNTDFLSQEDKFKFVDDLSTLEILNLIMVGLASNNFKEHVASDIGINQLFLPKENVKSQSNMDNICDWTEQRYMQLNDKKIKGMIINF
jgi:hypothetical protein